MPAKSYLPPLVVLYAAGFVGALNENLVNVALVDVMGEFGITAGDAQWLVTGYMIVTSVIMVLSAFLVGRFRLRSLFFAATVCMAAGESLCIVLPAFPLVLTARLLQSVGSGLFIPLMMNAVLIVSPRERLGSLLAVGNACIVLGPALAPIVSGIVTSAFGWRMIFVVPLVLCVLCAVVGIPLLKNLGETRRMPLDILSVILAAIGLSLFVYGLGDLSSHAPIGIAATVAGALVIAWFVRRQNRLEHPLLDMRPMRDRRFVTACVLVMISMMMTFSMGVLLPLYLEGAHALTALMAGLALLPAVLVNAATAVVGGRIMDAKGPWPLIPIGFLLMAAGQVVVAWAGGAGLMIVVVATCAFVFGGSGLAMSPSQTTGLRVLPPEENPHGVSIVNVLVMVAASIGTSLYVGVFETARSASQAAGMAVEASVQAGFGIAVVVAAVIAAIGLVFSVFFARRNRGTGNQG